MKFSYSVFNGPFFAHFCLWQCLRFGGHIDFEISISFLECLSVTSPLLLAYICLVKHALQFV